MLFMVLAGIAALLILTLPYPHSVYVLLLMIYCYVIEVFYQVEKRIPQVFPFPQLIGRTDFALFPVAGYICAGSPDTTAFLYFIFFYPFAIAHLGVNDLIDEANDRARGLRTIPTIYDAERTTYWIAGFTVIHAMMAVLFITRLGLVARAGVYAGLVLLVIANIVILKYRTPDAALKVLPLFHMAMVLYAAGIVLGAIV
jgi:4-hydroxybenzoate polyprenyltransferase